MSNEVIIFGGMFDPIHYGHFTIAEIIRKMFSQSQLWLLPTFIDVVGEKSPVDFAHRVEMIKIAIDTFSLPYKICTEEAEFGRPIGTYAVLKRLQEKFPNKTFSFLIGSDIADSIRTWRNSRKLLSEFKLVVVRRGGALPPKEDSWVYKKPHVFIDSPLVLSISSTEIRNELKSGIRFPVDLSYMVAGYIHQHKLYQ